MPIEWVSLAMKGAPMAGRLATTGMRKLLQTPRVAYTGRRSAKKQGIGTLRFWALCRYLGGGDAVDAIGSGDAARLAALGSDLVALYKTAPSDPDAAQHTVDILINAFSSALNINAAVAMHGGVTANKVTQELGKLETTRQTYRANFDNNLMSLPPMRAAEARRLRSTWPAVEFFVGELVASPDRGATLRSWQEDRPSWLQDRPTAAVAWFARLASDYRQSSVSSAAYGDAVDAGATPASYWRTREILSRDLGIHEQALLLGPVANEDPLASAVVAIDEDRLDDALSTLTSWAPSEPVDRAIRAVLRSQVVASRDLTLAIEISAAGAAENNSATCAILQAQYLIRRGSSRGSAIDFADLELALETALKARDAMRRWQGPSWQAVESAVSAARLLGRFELAWRLTQPSPEGDAIPEEAVSPAVRHVAAVLAASAGRREQALDLLPADAEPGVRHEVLALLAISERQPHTELIEWQAAMAHATEAQDIARIGLYIALLGEHPEKLDALRATDPGFAADITLIADAYAGNTEAVSILRARTLSSRTLAHPFIGLLVQQGNLLEAAEVSQRAGRQWSDPEFSALAAEQYFDLQRFDEAAATAREALRIAGPSWEGSPRVTAVLINALLNQNDWEMAASAATELLSREPENISAVWVLTQCQYQLGQFDESWRSYSELGRRPAPRSEDEALVCLDLWRRYEGSYAHVAVITSLLDAFSDSEKVKAAIIGALVRMDVDGDDVEAIDRVRALLQPLLEDHQELFVQRQIDPDDPLASLTEILDEFYDDAIHDPRIDSGQFPIGMAATIHRRTLTEVLAKGPQTALFSGDHETFEAEVDAALDAIGRSVVADLTALYALSVLPPESADQLVGSFLRPRASRAQLIDAIMGVDALAALSTLSIARGADGSAVAVQITEDVSTAAEN